MIARDSGSVLAHRKQSAFCFRGKSRNLILRRDGGGSLEQIRDGGGGGGCCPERTWTHSKPQRRGLFAEGYLNEFSWSGRGFTFQPGPLKTLATILTRPRSVAFSQRATQDGELFPV